MVSQAARAKSAVSAWPCCPGAVPITETLYARSQANVGFVDNIDEGTRTNGTAVLDIAFSDGSTGILTVGCHGPGAPPGIFEGIAATKGNVAGRIGRHHARARGVRFVEPFGDIARPSARAPGASSSAWLASLLEGGCR
jgi:hypothetical protein